MLIREVKYTKVVNRQVNVSTSYDSLPFERTLIYELRVNNTAFCLPMT